MFERGGTHRLRSRQQIQQFWLLGNGTRPSLELDDGVARLQTLPPTPKSCGSDPSRALASALSIFLAHPGTFRFERHRWGEFRPLLYVHLLMLLVEEDLAVQNVVYLGQGYSR